jgi:hypothetical protein
MHAIAAFTQSLTYRLGSRGDGGDARTREDERGGGRRGGHCFAACRRDINTLAASACSCIVSVALLPALTHTHTHTHTHSLTHSHTHTPSQTRSKSLHAISALIQGNSSYQLRFLFNQVDSLWLIACIPSPIFEICMHTFIHACIRAMHTC